MKILKREKLFLIYFFPEFSIQKVKDYFNESDQNRRTADIASFTEKNGKLHFCVVKVLA